MHGNANPMHIFLAVDGSEYARGAVETICSLPLPPSTRVTALAVLDTPHTLRRQLLLDELDQVQDCFLKRGIQSETGLLHGHPAEALTEFADKYHPDLIVMGARGLRATLGILLGGIAQQVIEYAQWPVLIVRPPCKDIRRVCFATDGSNYSTHALKYLNRFPLPPDIELHIVNVISPYPIYQTGRYSQIMLGGADALHPVPVELLEEAENWEIQAEEQGQQLLADCRDYLEKPGVQVITKLLHGDAATEILKYCQDNAVDLISAGSRGLSQMRGWLLGSVSRKLVHYAPSSVLIIRGAIEE